VAASVSRIPRPESLSWAFDSTIPGRGDSLTVDPVLGGSCNNYDYVCADPVNSRDLDGRWKWTKYKCKYATGTRHFEGNKKAPVAWRGGALSAPLRGANQATRRGRTRHHRCSYARCRTCPEGSNLRASVYELHIITFRA
jgi:hypothetical protein